MQVKVVSTQSFVHIIYSNDLHRTDLPVSASLGEVVDGLGSFISWKERVSQISDHTSPVQECPLIKLEASLNNLDLKITSPGSSAILRENQQLITDILAKATTPLGGEWIWYEDEFTKSFNAKWQMQKDFTDQALPILLVVSIHWMEYLRAQDPKVELKALKLIESLLCYVIDDDSYPWAIPSNLPNHKKLFNALLDTTQPFIENSAFRTSLLEDIKPAFINHSKHPSISAAGRKVFTADEDTLGSSRNFTFSYLPEDEQDAKSIKSWRTNDQFALSLLDAYLGSSETKEVQGNWSFILPCVLNITDDHNPGIKRKGADLICTLVKHTVPAFFKQTGVTPVLWSALKPALSYLPPSTPAGISIPLTKSTYNAMMALSYCSATSAHKLHHEYFQEGILLGISHVHNHTRALTNFINITTDLVLEHMKTYTTPHLKPLIAIVTGTLCDPFVTFSPDLVSATSALAEAIIRATWFRVITHRYDLLRALVTVSKRIADDTNSSVSVDQANSMRGQVKRIFSLLQQAVEINTTSPEKLDGVENFKKELEILQKQEPTFGELLR